LEVRKAPTAIICLSPYSGGMEIDSIKMAKKLSPYCETILIAKKDHFIAKEMQNAKEISLQTLSFNNNFGPSLIFGIRKIINNYNIKNVIFFGASELKSMYFSFLGLDINLIIRHGTTKSRPKKDWFHKLIYSKVNCHVAICEHLANNVKHIIPFGKNTQLKTIYSSLPNTPLSKNKEKSSKLRLLHIGRIADAKGQKDAILACEVLVKNEIDFELTLVGGFHQEYKKEFLSFLEECPYHTNINIIGHTNDVQHYLDTNDIFLFPSHGEGLSNAFLEALANNLVCIAYDNTSFPELQHLGFYFNIIDNKNISKLKEGIYSISQRLENEQKKSFQNNQLTQSIFSLEQEIEKYHDILN